MNVNLENNRSYVKAFIFIFLLVAANAAIAAQVCKVEGGILTTKAGYKILLDFGSHPSEDLSWLNPSPQRPATPTFNSTGLWDRITDTESFTREETRTYVAGYISANRALIDEYQRRRTRVANFSRVNSITWIGVESSPSRFQGGARELSTRVKNYRMQLTRAGVSKRDIERAIPNEFGMGGGGYAWMTNEIWQSRVTIVPLEGNEAMEKANPTRYAEQNLYQTASEHFQNQKLSRSEYQRITSKYRTLIMSGRTLSSNDIGAFSARFRGEEARLLAKRYMEVGNSFITTSADREREVVLNALAQGGNGVISFGLAHKKSLTRQLEASCKATPGPTNLRGAGKAL